MSKTYRCVPYMANHVDLEYIWVSRFGLTCGNCIPLRPTGRIMT